MNSEVFSLAADAAFLAPRSARHRLLQADDVDAAPHHIVQEGVHVGGRRHCHDVPDLLQRVAVRAAGEPYPVPACGCQGLTVGVPGHTAAYDLVGVEALRDILVQIPLADADLDTLVGHEVAHRMGGRHDAVLPLQHVQEHLRRAVPEGQPRAFLQARAYVAEPEALQVGQVVEVHQYVRAVRGADLHPRDHWDLDVLPLDPDEGLDQVVVRDGQTHASLGGEPDGRPDVGE